MVKMKHATGTNNCKTYMILVLFIINLTLPNVLGNLFKFKADKHLNRQKRSSLLESREKREIIKYSGEINNLRGKTGDGYYLEVEIGTPKQKFNVLIDTGSSNFAIACAPSPDISKYFHSANSSTFTDLGTTVSVPYTVGSWEGTLGQDYITIASLPNSTVKTNIACITKSEGFFINGSHWQGIMGLGYADIARPDSTVEPIFDSLVKSNLVNNYFSVQLCGLGYIQPNPEEILGGTMIFGGTNSSLYRGPLYATPINKEWYYEVVIVDIQVDGQSLNMDCKEYNFGKTIVDTGTTNLRLPSKVFDTLIAKMKTKIETSAIKMPSESFWTGDDMLCWTSGHIPYNSFPTLSITLPVNNTRVFRLKVSPQQYLRAVGNENDKSPQEDCYKLAVSKLESGTVIGAVILEGFYVVFDRVGKTVQFGESTCTQVDMTAVRSSIDGNIPYTGDYKDCAYVKLATHDKTLTIVGYVMAGICGVCMVPLVVLVIQYQIRRCACHKKHSTLKRSNSDRNDLMESSSS